MSVIGLLQYKIFILEISIVPIAERVIVVKVLT